MRMLSQLNYVDVVAKTGSIRKAAAKLNITSTALNRRIIALEEELGTPIFERLPQGVRLNTAGELLIQHIRQSMAELSKVTSQIADLSGVRRGHIKIAGGSEVIGSFLPKRIADYRQDYADVSFEILRRSPENALKALGDFDADLSLVFAPVPPSEFQILASVELEICLALRAGHPLANTNVITWEDCLDYPAIVPSEGSGLYNLLAAAQMRKGMPLRRAITSESFEFMMNYSHHEFAITFKLRFEDDDQIQNPSIEEQGLITRSFADQDKLYGRLHLVQAKGRVLPVASAKFAETIIQYFNMALPNQTT